MVRAIPKAALGKAYGKSHLNLTIYRINRNTNELKLIIVCQM
jgi:hypothetical protein